MTLRQKFWVAVARFAFRRARIITEKAPTGLPGIRDSAHPCRMYAPRRPHVLDFQDCQGDGHYLCGECAHIDRTPREEEGP